MNVTLQARKFYFVLFLLCSCLTRKKTFAPCLQQWDKSLENSNFCGATQIDLATHSSCTNIHFPRITVGTSVSVYSLNRFQAALLSPFTIIMLLHFTKLQLSENNHNCYFSQSSVFSQYSTNFLFVKCFFEFLSFYFLNILISRYDIRHKEPSL